MAQYLSQWSIRILHVSVAQNRVRKSKIDMHARTVRSRVCSRAGCLWCSKIGRAPVDRRNTAGSVHATTGPWRAAETGPRSVADNRNTPPLSAHPSSCSPTPPLQLFLQSICRYARCCAVQYEPHVTNRCQDFHTVDRIVTPASASLRVTNETWNDIILYNKDCLLIYRADHRRMHVF